MILNGLGNMHSSQEHLKQRFLQNVLGRLKGLMETHKPIIKGWTVAPLDPFIAQPQYLRF